MKTLPKSVVDLVKYRDPSGLCEVGTICEGMAFAVQTAHRLGKQAGGVGKKNTTKNVASNLLRGCVRCHNDIDNKRVKHAESLGLKVRDGVAFPSEIPVKHARFGWVLLDDDGEYRSAPPVSYESGPPFVPVIACPAWDLMLQAGLFMEAMERFGHLQCPGWSPPREGLFTCGCGSSPFVLEAVV